MKTICKTYACQIAPKQWMTAFTGMSYLLISIVLYIRPFDNVYGMTTAFGVLLLPAAFLDMYFSSGNKDKIFSWGFLLLNAIADFAMAIVFILHSYMDNSTLLYFGSFWVLGKGMMALNFSSLIKKQRLLKLIYNVSSLATLVLAMLLVTNALFSDIQIDTIFTSALLLCALNKFISVFLLSEKHY
ncbi:hypothetical protein [Flammeovirga aprica]|uniref:Uncharacterized protein n=1 Tax=Flammeovirga aprica JL-4 TaxID=694437 RepID=A0A7X9P3L0_9BACT|nr:hypothetical protein [Flammeovirga aprica]NME68437.1 hypothetical protein [Flammeovirga aprica JL-4]